MPGEDVEVEHGLYASTVSVGIIDRTGAQTMLYLTCTMISSVDLAHYGVSRAKNYWVSVGCGTKYSRLSLSRNRRGHHKHYEISVLRHIRFVILRKKTI